MGIAALGAVASVFTGGAAAGGAGAGGAAGAAAVQGSSTAAQPITPPRHPNGHQASGSAPTPSGITGAAANASLGSQVNTTA